MGTNGMKRIIGERVDVHVLLGGQREGAASTDTVQ